MERAAARAGFTTADTLLIPSQGASRSSCAEASNIHATSCSTSRMPTGSAHCSAMLEAMHPDEPLWHGQWACQLCSCVEAVATAQTRLHKTSTNCRRPHDSLAHHRRLMSRLLTDLGAFITVAVCVQGKRIIGFVLGGATSQTADRPWNVHQATCVRAGQAHHWLHPRRRYAVGGAGGAPAEQQAGARHHAGRHLGGHAVELPGAHALADRGVRTIQRDKRGLRLRGHRGAAAPAGCALPAAITCVTGGVTFGLMGLVSLRFQILQTMQSTCCSALVSGGGQRVQWSLMGRHMSQPD